MDAIKTHYRTCNLCEAMCGIVITYQNKHIISIKGDKEDTLSRGHICPKATALEDLHNDKDRLKTPIKRTENGWKSISWEEAYSEVSFQLKKIIQKKNIVFRCGTVKNYLQQYILRKMFLKNIMYCHNPWGH